MVSQEFRGCSEAITESSLKNQTRLVGQAKANPQTVIWLEKLTAYTKSSKKRLLQKKFSRTRHNRTLHFAYAMTTLKIYLSSCARSLLRALSLARNTRSVTVFLRFPLPTLGGSPSVPLNNTLAVNSKRNQFVNWSHGSFDSTGNFSHTGVTISSRIRFNNSP